MKVVGLRQSGTKNIPNFTYDPIKSSEIFTEVLDNLKACYWSRQAIALASTSETYKM